MNTIVSGSACKKCFKQWGHTWVPVLVAVLIAFVSVSARAEFSNDDCLMCHGYDEEFSTTLPSEEEMHLYVSPDEYAESVHGQMDFTCDTCHEGYTEYPHPNKDFTTLRGFAAKFPDVCAQCHPDESATYLEDFHGKSVSMRKQMGSTNGEDTASAPEAVCSDCHGSHDILRPSDPNSSVFQANLAETCGACHDNATGKFALAFAKHKRPNPESSDSALTYWINKIYEILIPTTVGGLGLFIGLELTYFARSRRKS